MAHSGFVRFWAADTVSLLGTYVTALALTVLAEKHLQSSNAEFGALNAARWVPYLLFGLIAGVLVDRYRRRPILLGADFARAGLLVLIPLLTATGLLTMPVLIGIVALFGALSLVYDAAHQSFLPQLVPAALLTEANARLEQTNSVAQGAGPTLAGWLIKVVGAGRAIIAGRWLTPVGYGLIPFATNGTTGLVLLFAGQFVFGVSIGLDGPAEMGYRQTVTPDRLQGRMNATMRSLNRGMIVLGAPLGGILADSLGYRTTLWIAIAGLSGQAIAISFSRVRTARLVS